MSSTTENGFLSNFRARRLYAAPAGLAERELWPELSWRLSALLGAGLSPQRTFERLLEDFAEYTPAHLPLIKRALPQLAREERAHEAARQDLRRLLERCADAARAGLPLSAAIRSSEVCRGYSATKTGELACCWYISETTGAPLSRVLERLARYYENEIDLHQARNSAMSGPKATAAILSWLPMLGLGLGMLMGTNPLGILFGSVVGAFVALLGVGLAVCGSRWTHRLIRRAEGGNPA